MTEPSFVGPGHDHDTQSAGHGPGPGRPEARGGRVWEANRYGVDYRVEAARFGPPVRPIIDVHTHINGERAAAIYRDVMDRFGVAHTYSQTQMTQAAAVRRVLGDRITFIAIPDYLAEDKRRAFREGLLENLVVWREEYGAGMMKIWNAPRWRDLARQFNAGDDLIDLDSPWRRKAADRAVELGMMLMAHIADPDTWFATKYADAAKYLTKAQHYEALERMLTLYPVPWMIAHMGGWPEDLHFLTGLLERHPGVVLDTSATKWMVRELSKHAQDDLVGFLRRFRGRILFGSDIVTMDGHLTPQKSPGQRFGEDLSSSPEDAFDLYASRYWALRTMWETDYDGESNIADPDLAMVDPANHGPMSAPRLVGRALPPDLLTSLYGGACEATVGAWYAARAGGRA